MAMRSSTMKGRFLKIDIADFPAKTLFLEGLRGEERISSPYRYDLDLVSPEKYIDPSEVLLKDATITIKQPVELGRGQFGLQELPIHGIVTEFEHRGIGPHWSHYRATVMPELWNLSKQVRSRIFLEKSIPDIVTQVFTDREGPLGWKAGTDFAMVLSGTYPQREYVVQYQESDLDFVSRLLEHAGIFYHFRQESSHEVMVLGDSPKAYGSILKQAEVRFIAAPTGESNPRNWFATEAVNHLVLNAQAVPARVELRDYDYRQVKELRAEADVSPKGIGTVQLYGEHFRSEAEGAAIAQVRAEELLCREKTFDGGSNCKAFRAGVEFKLADHPSASEDFNRKHLIVEISHEAKQELTTDSARNPVASVVEYRNRFRTIPADRTFRPARVTPKPKIHGTINAKVDAAGDGEYAELDEHGRYKVKLSIDPSDADQGTASRYVRMAQPYAGADYGMHFPLHKGVDVILTHVNGDPDRPIISGAVPNPKTGSPVRAANQMQCAIVTGGGNRFVIDDDVGRMTMSTPNGNTWFRIGEHNSAKNGICGKTDDHYCLDVKQTSRILVGKSEHHTIGDGGQMIFIGKDAESKLPEAEALLQNKPGSQFVRIEGDQKVEVNGCRHNHIRDLTWDLMLGGRKRFILGGRWDTIVGVRVDLLVGNRTDTIIGAKTEIHRGPNIKSHVGSVYELSPKHYEKTPTVLGQFKDFLQMHRKCVLHIGTEFRLRSEKRAEIKANHYLKKADKSTEEGKRAQQKFEKWNSKCVDRIEKAERSRSKFDSVQIKGRYLVNNVLKVSN